jgi:DNA mismatch repair ATPase MutS
LINEKIKDCKCLILVDEIFKGTNANDRINASLMVIDKLNKYNQYFIISTHDFELCDANDITNYHFNETYSDDKILFDYKIKEGKSDTKNAIFLLKMANIIE